MDNRKIIITFYIAVSSVLWVLSRAGFQYVYMTFYQIRRMPGIQFLREGLPIILAVGLFAFLLRHSRVNELMDEVVAELRKVTWPTRDDVVKSTTVVLVCILIASVILGFLDGAWGKIVGYLLKA